MYSEYIEKLNPKPRFNLSFYNDEDKYSDGDIEDTILKIIADNEPEEYTKAIADNFCWPVYYHLTHIRQNILNWYPFEKDANVLEIGCGFGAITSALCDRAKKVTAVELSKRRAMGAYLRCREKENLEILVGNLNDIVFEEKFDYITLIGVLEYQGSYTDGENPYEDFLKKIRTLLKPSGKLLIAIENQYGLKYWCGAYEDHTLLPFDGINGYRYTDKKVRTFSKNELNRLVMDSGFEKTFFYYPLPDYKLPQAIYSQERIPTSEDINSTDFYYVTDSYCMTMEEKRLYKDIIENGCFEFFANSFFVECSIGENIGQVKYASLGCRRKKSYRIGTALTADNAFRFELERGKATAHLNAIAENSLYLEKRGLKVIDSELSTDFGIKMPLYKGTDAEKYLLKLYDEGDVQGVYGVFDRLYSEIIKSSDAIGWEQNIIFSSIAGIQKDKSCEDKYGVILEKGFIDLILRNAFMQQDEWYWFDQEWVLEGIPAGFVLFRAIIEFYGKYKERVSNVISIPALAGRYNLLMVWKEYVELNKLFMDNVIDRLHMEEEMQFWGNEYQGVINAVNRVMKREG